MARGAIWVDDTNVALLTDLYELTMASSYHRQDMNRTAVFDLFVRELPAERNFLVAAGLEFALDFLEHAHFEDDAIGYLSSLRFFSTEFLDYLRGWTFTGEVRAIAEGNLFWPPEPVITVTAPLIEAQLTETFLINCLTFSTMIASKAARVTIGASGHRWDDFSLRRTHGADAGLKVARSAYIGGATGTSNVLAGKVFDMQVSGTMAHSYVMAFGDELEAFRQFARDHPGRAVFLIDTFDTEEGARRAAQVAEELRSEDISVRGVRLDSGDLDALSKSVRKILDDAGFHELKIFASGDLDEYRVRELVRSQAAIDAFGVGTQLGTSADAPFLGGVYKLVEYDGRPVLKLSAQKTTLPGRKQVHRNVVSGQTDHDVIALEGEELGGEPLLEVVMKDGRRIAPQEPIEAMHDRFAAALEGLSEELLALEPAGEPYEVGLSPRLREVVADATRRGGRRPMPP
jgi:nicotinate phosphoribosyltransferase